MGLSTQVSARDRQTASLYPYPLTPLLGVVNLGSAVIITGILGDFVYELVGEKMNVPSELAVVLAVSSITVVEQIVSFGRQKLSRFPAKLNLAIHSAMLLLWIIAFSLLTYRIQGMVLSHSCDLRLWRTEMGLMVCRMYKAMYAFSAICVVTAVASVLLDWSVFRDGSAGAYRSLAEVTPDLRQTAGHGTPLMRGEKEMMTAVSVEQVGY